MDRVKRNAEIVALVKAGKMPRRRLPRATLCMSPRYSISLLRGTEVWTASPLDNLCSPSNSDLSQPMGQHTHTRTAAGIEIRGEMP